MLRGEREVLRALEVVKSSIVKDFPPKTPIELFMELMTIKDCLEEILAIRKLIEAHKD